MNAPINNAKPAALPLISDTAEARIIQAFSDLHAVLASYGNPLPAFGECGADEYERLARRGLNALKAVKSHRKEQAIAHLRQGAKDVIAPYITEHRAAKEEFDSLSPTLRAKLGEFAQSVNIPVSDFADIFPQGATVANMVVTLKDLGYTMGQSKDKSYFVKVAVSFGNK